MPVTSVDLVLALRERFALPQWVLATEVRNRTGYGRGPDRRADAVAMNCWPSGKYGHELHGFEVKVTRADWTRELKRPDKATPVRSQCDRWWVVAPAGVVREEELSGTPMGLLVLASSGKLECDVEAVRVGERAPVARSFMASLLRAAADPARVEAEGVRGAMLKAPIRAVVDSKFKFGGGRDLTLSCGHHVHQRSVDRAVKARRCLQCPPSGEGGA